MASPTTTQGHDRVSSSDANNNVFIRLASLPPGSDKNTLMSTIDEAVNTVLCELMDTEAGPLPPTLITKVQTSLAFLEQCLSFKDDEFTRFAKKRAHEMETALTNTVIRIEKAHLQTQKEIQSARETAAKLENDQAEPKTKTPPAPVKTQAEPPAPKSPGEFEYEHEEAVVFKYASEVINKRLAFLRGDTVVVEKRKAVTKSGIHEDGVPHFFILSPLFPAIFKDALHLLVREKRDLLARRIYRHLPHGGSDEEIRAAVEADYKGQLISILALGLDSWAGELEKAGIGGLPFEESAPKKKKEKENTGIGASLKKVFSFSKKEKVEKVTVRKESNPIKVHAEWEKLDHKGQIYLSEHFSFSIISYILTLSESQFETEFECIRQIVDQQESADVGPVVSNLSRLYKFYDNIFFDLVILTLFHRTNKFDINMLQAACMSQNFVVNRLPLTMDELRRRPMAHAKHVLHCLRQTGDPDSLKTALKDYFYVHETIHANKVGKRITASENLLKRQIDKMSGGPKRVLEKMFDIISELNNMKKRQEDDGVFLGEEMQELIDKGLKEAVLLFSK